MLDYSLNNDEKKEFILFYERIQNILVIHYANGDTKKIIYTNINETEIINKMEQQVRNYDPEIMKYYANNYKNSVLIRSSILPVCSVSTISVYDEKFLSIPIYTIIAIGTLGLLKKGSEYVLTSNKQKDYEKHKLYLDNKEIISEYVRGDLRPLNGFSKKVITEAKSNIDNKVDTVNINTIRIMKLEEIKKLVEEATKRKEEDNKKYELKK